MFGYDQKMIIISAIIFIGLLVMIFTMIPRDRYSGCMLDKMNDQVVEMIPYAEKQCERHKDD